MESRNAKDRTRQVSWEDSSIERTRNFCRREPWPASTPEPESEALYTKLVAVDEIGVWIENPGWKSSRDGGDWSSHRIHVLVPWGQLISIGAFPRSRVPQ